MSNYFNLHQNKISTFVLMCLPAESATGELPDTECLIGQPPAIITPIVACLDGIGAEGTIKLNASQS